MVQTIKKITLEVYKPNIFKVIVAKKGDSKSRFLKVTVVDDNKKINIPIDAEVLINATRSDGEAKSFVGVSNTDGTVTVPLTSWMLYLAGIVLCDVSVIDAENRKLTTSTFNVEVEDTACDSGDISEDENYDILVKLIEEVKQAKGLTAYEIALQHGFEGTEEEWLASLVGKNGYTPQKGIDYFDGKDGADGKDGKDGYTPEKGKDYFTEEDKSELVTDVLNALPVWQGGEY